MPTSYDIQEIKEQVAEVIRCSQEIADPKVDDLINQWERAKKSFIDAFGEKLIYTYPEKVQFNLDEKAKRKKFYKFIEEAENDWRVNGDFVDFIYANQEGFFSNEVIVASQNNDGEAIPVGMKLFKAFKFFINDKETLYYYQNLASSYQQEDKVEGTLCFSVHPLDFLSSSENNHGWRSCHALDGEYRAGNLSYMTDPTTIICYLKSDEDTKLAQFGNIKWNNKKWRMLLFFSQHRDLIFAGRQYPFQSNSALDIIKEVLSKEEVRLIDSEMAQYYTKWSNKTIEDYLPPESAFVLRRDQDKYIPINGKLLDKFDIIQDKCNLHYDDLLHSSCYKPYYTYFNTQNLPWYCYAKDYYKNCVKIGNNHIKCLQCGENCLDDSEWMICSHCRDEVETFYCSGCDIRYLEDEEDKVYMANGDILCSACFENCGFYCDGCGEAYYTDDIVLAPSGDCFCPACAERMGIKNETD